MAPAFNVKQTSDPTFDVKINVGTTAAEAREAAKQMAGAVYASAPTGNAAGQQYKNSLIAELIAVSGRCRQAATAALGNGSPKAVKSD